MGKKAGKQKERKRKKTSKFPKRLMDLLVIRG